jgi:hypothetical protein
MGCAWMWTADGGGCSVGCAWMRAAYAAWDVRGMCIGCGRWMAVDAVDVDGGWRMRTVDGGCGWDADGECE